MNTSIKAVAIPVQNNAEFPYLTTLVHRFDTFTTMIWGWRSANAKKMALPREILRKEQKHIPFLFSELIDNKRFITHIGISGFICHKEEIQSDKLSEWLTSRRVEVSNLSEDQWSD